MERIRKSYADFYAERFACPEEFIDVLKKREGEEKKNTRGSDVVEWKGASSWEEVYGDLISAGPGLGRWGAAKFSNRLRGLKEVCEEIETKGSEEPNGKPSSKKGAKRRPKPRELEFLFLPDDVDRSTDPRVYAGIEGRRLDQLAGIALLERDYGYRCSISLGCVYYYGRPRENRTNAACLVKLKKADEPFDIERLSCLALKPNSISAALARWGYTLSHEDGLNEEYGRYGVGCGYRDPDYGEWEYARKIGFLDAVKEPQSGIVPLEFGTKIEDVLERLLTPISVGRETIPSAVSPEFATLETLEDGAILAHVNHGLFFDGDWIAAQYDPAMDVTRETKGGVREGNQLMGVLKEQEMEERSYD